ncbi:hypothetical protein H9L39_15107 [Fusarium oxysporum f. sp. albedinis]|nr:hypothetical protein H9L39_15107 [Fusarium oxysporum f. sp. albedinis]
MANILAINRPGFSSPILSEALIHNGLVYTSGKIGVDAKTSVLVSDDVAEQTCNIYLTNINDFAAMNAVYIATIPNPKPARVCVTVSELGKGAKIEIDCIAIVEKAL